MMSVDKGTYRLDVSGAEKGILVSQSRWDILWHWAFILNVFPIVAKICQEIIVLCDPPKHKEVFIKIVGK